MIRALQLLLLILPFLAASIQAAPAASDSYPQTVEEFAQLRKRDPGARRSTLWRGMARSFEQLLDRQLPGDKLPRTLFFLGNIYHRLYERGRVARDGERAMDFYSRLAGEHFGHSLADDALLSLGDLRRDIRNDEALARLAFYEVIDLYPASNSAPAARRSVDSYTARAKLGSVPPAAASVLASEPTAAAAEVPPAERLSSVSRPVYQAEERLHRPLIVIDPGHGGEDLGASGGEGSFEKDIVLDVAKTVGRMLEERLRARVLLTRTTDVFVPLQERIAIANREKANLFISVHANASEHRKASGIETYYLDNTEERSSLRLAERENSSLRFEGRVFDVSFIVSDLIQSSKVEDSISVSHHLQENLAGMLGRYYREVNDLGVKKAPFYVLVGAHMPCALVEISFIDHPIEGERLRDPRYRQLVALGLYQGVASYFVKREVIVAQAVPGVTLSQAK